MVVHNDRRRMLLVSDDQDRWALRAILEAACFRGWDVLEADSIERARFVLQMDPCDVLLLDADLYRSGDPSSVSWLAAQRQAPVLLVADPEPATIVSALHNGAMQWLPRDVIVRFPEILAGSLQQLAQVGDLQHKGRATSEALSDCRKQVSRLVSLLWDATPGDGRRPWFPQRHMLERLEEEVARSQRHSDPLTVVLAEIQAEGLGRLPPEDSQRLASWTVLQVTEGKRRSDIAGQYGMNGFMLLLPHTTDEGAAQCCRRIRVKLEQLSASATRPLPPLHACFGVVSFSAAVNTAKGLLSRAEERLERAKAGEEAAV